MVQAYCAAGKKGIPRFRGQGFGHSTSVHQHCASHNRQATKNPLQHQGMLASTPIINNNDSQH
jgi:hypothetical protein